MYVYIYYCAYYVTYIYMFTSGCVTLRTRATDRESYIYAHIYENDIFICVHTYMYEDMRVIVNTMNDLFIYVHTYTYMYIYVCV